jgi:hypothetical protein
MKITTFLGHLKLGHPDPPETHIRPNTMCVPQYTPKVSYIVHIMYIHVVWHVAVLKRVDSALEVSYGSWVGGGVGVLHMGHSPPTPYTTHMMHQHIIEGV